MTKIRGYGRIFFFLFLFDLRLWDWNWTWGYSRPVFAHHGTSSHKPALQRPRWSHSSRSSVSVWQAFHEIQSGTNWSLNLSALTCPHKLFFLFLFYLNWRLSLHFVSEGTESAFPEPDSAASPVQGRATTFQQERTAQRRWGKRCLENVRSACNNANFSMH